MFSSRIFIKESFGTIFRVSRRAGKLAGSWILAPQIRILLLKVLLDPLQHLHLVLDLQVDLRLLKMVPIDSP